MRKRSSRCQSIFRFAHTFLVDKTANLTSHLVKVLMPPHQIHKIGALGKALTVPI